jgi:ketosteroid isomerase-like protein
MRRLVTIGAIVFAVPTLAFAHVSVRPRESKPGVEEKYTVRVPTEGAVATTQVQLEIPAGVTVLEVLTHEGATFETARHVDRITAITWKKDIPPKGSAEFVFRALNPASGDVVWKAHQHLSDGTVADWVGGAGDKRPASVTKLVAAASAGAAQAPDNDAAAIEAWLKRYDVAFNAKDLDTLAAFYHPDVTIYEGGGINNGWIDYRDRHLGPELKAFENLQFGHSNTKVAVLPGGQSAYATSEYSIKAKMGEREIDSRGLETLVLVKGADGNWKIRHSHTSSRPARRPAAQQS